MLLVNGVVSVAVLLPVDKLPLAVPTTPAGMVAAQAKLVGLMLDDTLITALAPEHIGPTEAGEVATGRGLTRITAVEVAGVHGPAGSLVVKVSVAFPVNPAGGVQVEVGELGFEKVPPTFEDQVMLEAAPPKVPFNAIAWPEQTPLG